MAWLVSSLRRLRDERLTAVGLTVLILVTAFLFAATPRLVTRTADDTLRATLSNGRPGDRNIQFLQADHRVPSNSDAPFAFVEAVADHLHDALPEAVARLIVDRSWTIDSVRWKLPQISGDAGTMRLRIQPDAVDRVRLESGRWPTEHTERVADPAATEDPAPRITQFEVALPVVTAEVLHVGVGDSLVLDSDPFDPLVGPGHEWTIGVIVVGTFSVNDAADEWWLGTTDLVKPSIRFLGDLQVNDTTALLAPEAYRAYMAETEPLFLPNLYTFREYVAPNRFDSGAVDGLIVELRRLEAAFPSTSPSFNQPVAVRTGLRAILEGFRGQWASALAILTVAVIGPATVAAAAVALVAVLAGRRRRSALALSRGRGASLGQVVAAVVAEGLLLGGPAAVLAILAAVVLVPADTVLVSVLAGSGVAVGAVALLVMATVPGTSGPAFGPARDTFVPRRPSARRLLFEGLVVIFAVAGAYLVRERSVRGASSTAALGTPDPFLAGVPALIGIAAAVAAVRLVPYPMWLLVTLARRRRDLVPVLAWRRAMRSNGGAPIFVVLLVAAAIGAFSSAVLVHLDQAADVGAWAEVGAAHRIDGNGDSIRSAFDPGSIAGVEASAADWSRSVPVGRRNIRATFVALAAADYDAVVSGTPADPDLPIDLLSGTPSVIPVIASRALAERPGGVALGAEFPVRVEGHTFPARVVAVRDQLPAIASEPLFVIASRDQIKALFPTATLAPTTIFIRAPDAAVEAIRAAVAAELPATVTVTSRAEVSAVLRASPARRAVEVGVATVVVVALTYAALAVAAGLALAGAARAIEIAHLRTLGLTGRQAGGLVILEHGPTVVLAFVLGAGLGLGVFVALRDGLGLEQLVGSRVAVPLTLDPVQLLFTVAAVVAVVGLGLALGTLMQRGAAPAAAVRRGFE
jgi:putative ABC transport system permease protein